MQGLNYNFRGEYGRWITEENTSFVCLQDSIGQTASDGTAFRSVDWMILDSGYGWFFSILEGQNLPATNIASRYLNSLQGARQYKMHTAVSNETRPEVSSRDLRAVVHFYCLRLLNKPFRDEKTSFDLDYSSTVNDVYNEFQLHMRTRSLGTDVVQAEMNVSVATFVLGTGTIMLLIPVVVILVLLGTAGFVQEHLSGFNRDVDSFEAGIAIAAASKGEEGSLQDFSNWHYVVLSEDGEAYGLHIADSFPKGCRRTDKSKPMRSGSVLWTFQKLGSRLRSQLMLWHSGPKHVLIFCAAVSCMQLRPEWHEQNEIHVRHKHRLLVLRPRKVLLRVHVAVYQTQCTCQRPNNHDAEGRQKTSVEKSFARNHRSDVNSPRSVSRRAPIH